MPEVAKRLKKLEVINDDGSGVAKKSARFKLSAMDETKQSGTYSLGVFLPVGALITDSYVYFENAVDVTGATQTPTLAFECEDASNLFTNSNIKQYSSGQLIQGAAAGQTGTFVKGIAADCEIKAVLGSAAITTGLIKGWVEYLSLE